jgi:hypothetical protein
MDGLLLLIIAAVVFVIFIFVVTRAVKTIMFIGVLVLVAFVLKATGFLG